jgi:hypothetical protein
MCCDGDMPTVELGDPPSKLGGSRSARGEMASKGVDFQLNAGDSRSEAGDLTSELLRRRCQRV